jgi:hypothetical protein
LLCDRVFKLRILFWKQTMAIACFIGTFLIFRSSRSVCYNFAPRLV